MEIKERLQDVFRKVFEEPALEIHEGMTAAEVAKWTSLTHLIMIDAVENEFHIKLLLKEIIRLKNVGDLLRLIAEKVAA
jgi:acyl carrier protein